MFAGNCVVQKRLTQNQPKMDIKEEVREYLLSGISYRALTNKTPPWTLNSTWKELTM